MNDGARKEDTLPLCRNRDQARLYFPFRLSNLPVAVLGFLAVLCAPPLARAQSVPTASRVGDLQLGGGLVLARSAYNFTPLHLVGGAFYVTFDKRNHWGGEASFRQSRPTTDSTVYERTYEIGPRIFIARGPLIPYAKVLYGRGVYNYSGSVANIAYNMYTYGGGVDVQVRRSINVRGDYEYQNWSGFPLGTLHPSVVTIGVAFHFHE